MKMINSILNNEEKKEMLEALEESEALRILYNNKKEEIEMLLDILTSAKSRNKKVFFTLYNNNPSNYENYTIKLVETSISALINGYIKNLEKKPSDAVIMYFIKIFKAVFFLYYDNTYLKKMRKF